MGKLPLPKKRRTGVILGLTAALAAGAAVQFCLVPLPGFMGSAAHAQQTPPAPPAPKVRVATAEKRQMAPRLEVPGTVHSRQDAKIAAEIAGRVVWVAEAGTELAAGDEIARVDDRAWRLELQELDAEIKSLQSQLEMARREADRFEKLAASGTAPAAKVEQTVSRRDVLAQDLVRAKARREQTALNVERAVIRAPFGGRLVSRNVELGEYSAPGKEIGRLVSTAALELRAQAPITVAAFIREGEEVRLSYGGSEAAGRISRIIPVGERQSRTFELRVAPPDGAAWVVGAAVRIAVPSAAPHEVVAVHRDALILRGTGAYVYRIKDDQSAERIPVTPGISDGEYVEVAGAVNPGDRLVVRGGERLKEGQKVDLDPKVS
ncbi:MAG TPA: efflux RND transporter periplasmic adaptor subunit [Azospirillaceae bacterium]|nr:efflux RND transporter periplasmic adaptor subunit [Azospirillaceae bacterium]